MLTRHSSRISGGHGALALPVCSRHAASNGFSEAKGESDTRKLGGYGPPKWIKVGDTVSVTLHIPQLFRPRQLKAVVKRVVPRENEAVNETWISDRDRFSYQGLRHEERLLKPRVKRDGVWHECDWDTALKTARDALAANGEQRDPSVTVLRPGWKSFRVVSVPLFPFQW